MDEVTNLASSACDKAKAGFHISILSYIILIREQDPKLESLHRKL